MAHVSRVLKRIEKKAYSASKTKPKAKRRKRAGGNRKKTKRGTSGKAKRKKTIGYVVITIKKAKKFKKSKISKDSKRVSSKKGIYSGRLLSKGVLTLKAVQRMRNTTRSVQKDRYFQALPPGKRITKSGSVYYEYRSNRSDASQKLKI